MKAAVTRPFRFRAALVFCLVIGSAVVASPAQAHLPKLYSGGATDYTRQALIREFPFSVDSTARDIDCERRLSRVKFKCRVSFFASDTSYRGEVNVRYILKVGNRLGYRYVMRLIHTNEYCIYGLDKPPSQCRDKVKEKGNGYA